MITDSTLMTSVRQKKASEESTLSVNIKDEMQRHKGFRGLVPLYCYTNENNNDKWSVREFPVDKQHISINASYAGGSGRHNSPEQNFNVTLTLLGNFWFVFKKQLKGHCLFNGINSYQDILLANSTTYLEFESSRMLISNRKQQSFDSASQKDSLRGLPEYGEFGLKTPLGQFRYSLQKSVLIGSNPICDINIKGQPFAAMIAVCKGRLQLIDFGFEQIMVNGEESRSKTVELHDGDSLTVGVYDFTVSFPDNCIDPVVRSIPEGSLCMVPIKRESKGVDRLYLPFGGSMIFGRGSNSDCIVEVDGISRKHAQVIVYDNHILVLDCYSTNGTFINNARITKRRAYPGDVISMGNMNFLLCYYNN